MPTFRVETPQSGYDAIVEQGALRHLAERIPQRSGKLFVVTTGDVDRLHGTALRQALGPRNFETLEFPGGESRKRLVEVEALAEQMVELEADRSSVVIGFGGGIVTDVAGFLAAIFMRGVPVIQIPTTLLAQVDAAVGGKTGVNLAEGKNLVGSFHQPLAVLIDPQFLSTLPEREYRAGLYEIIKCGVIRDASLFHLFHQRTKDVIEREPLLVEHLIASAVRIKAEVVSADEREGGLRRILNFGHTVGHALEAATGYSQFLHGEAVAFGMRAATGLAERLGLLRASDAVEIRGTIEAYGPIPSLDGVSARALAGRLKKDKKTIQGHVHFVLPVAIGEVRIISDASEGIVTEAIEEALAAPVRA